MKVGGDDRLGGKPTPLERVKRLLGAREIPGSFNRCVFWATALLITFLITLFLVIVIVVTASYFVNLPEPTGTGNTARTKEPTGETISQKIERAYVSYKKRQERMSKMKEEGLAQVPSPDFGQSTTTRSVQ